MKILVTGGSGTIGLNLQEQIQNDKSNIWLFPSSKELNLIDLSCVDAYFDKHKPNFVIHLAANVGGLHKNLKYKVEMFRENILMNENILYCANKYDVSNGIFCCSTCIFPSNPIQYPMTENMIMQGEPHESNDSYGYAKRMLYFQCKNYNKQFNRKYICITPCNIFGKYDNFNLQNSHVVAGLIHKFYLASNNSKYIEIKTGLESKRQFIDAVDICKIIILLIENFKIITFDNIILANDDVLIVDLIKIINSSFNDVTVKIIDNELGQIKKTCSQKLFQQTFPNYKMSDLNDSIKNTIEWFKTNYDHARK